MTAIRPSARWRWRQRRQRFIQMLWLWRNKGALYAFKRALLRLGLATRDYEKWIEANDSLSPQDIALIGRRILHLQRRPMISLVLVLENGSAVALQRAIESLLAQLYENWELLIVARVTAPPELSALLAAYRNADARIKVIEAAACGVAAANAGLVEARGEFIGFFGPDDQLAPHALYMIAETVNAAGEAAIVYTDEDMIDGRGRRSAPQFKTDWNLDLFQSQNYFGRLTVYRRDLVVPTGLREGYEGSEEYDLALRIVERIAPEAICHVPYVLAHCASQVDQAESTGGHVLGAQRALQSHLDRVGIRATVEAGRAGHRVRRILPTVPPRVSIIIPTRDRLDFLRDAVESIRKQTNYSNYEVVIVDNQSVEPETLSYLTRISELENVRVLRFDHAFNYSAINNFAAKQCQSPILAFLNNDILVTNEDWLSEMVAHTIRSEVGAVGAMLYYPDDVIQHAGILVGFGGVAVNCYSGLRRGSSGYFHRAELTQNYSAVTGACMLTRAEVFADIGGFNEVDLPVAFNDVDYCLRLRARGFLITWTPYAELYHLESVSRGDDMAPSKIARFRRDQAYMAERWATVLSNDPYYNPNLSLDEIPFELAAQSRVRRPWKTEV